MHLINPLEKKVWKPAPDHFFLRGLKNGSIDFRDIFSLRSEISHSIDPFLMGELRSTCQKGKIFSFEKTIASKSKIKNQEAKSKKRVITMSKEICETITNKIIEKLELGMIPWRKPFQDGNETPVNWVTQKPYQESILSF